jgi:hypothetical protein
LVCIEPRDGLGLTISTLQLKQGAPMVVNPKILIMRVVLGLLFAYLLAHFFFPTAGIPAIIFMAAVLVFFSYVFEAIHRREK